MAGQDRGKGWARQDGILGHHGKDAAPRILVPTKADARGVSVVDEGLPYGAAERGGGMRPRFTISTEKWKRACEYAEATNRTPSELVNEALDQIQSRYPKPKKAIETYDLSLLVEKVAERLAGWSA
jgi:hypothetical protein